MAKRDTFYKIGRYATVPTFVSLAVLLAILFIPGINRFLNREMATTVTVSLFFIFCGAFLFGRLGLPTFLTGEAYIGVIPGILNSRMPSFFARLLGAFYMLIGALSFLIGFIMLPTVLSQVIIDRIN